jgi:indole-3-glycerol phosphate synthase
MSVQLAPILQKLADATRARIAREQQIETERELVSRAVKARRPHEFDPVYGKAGVMSKEPNIIAEFKKASPSEGDIAPTADPVQVARSYTANGARALSVLTEPSHFKGKKEDLRAIREDQPEAMILMKDFFLDWYQLLQARVYGADGILLIVDFIDRDLLTELYNLARKWLGLTPLLEVHDPDQLEFALKLGSYSGNLIGINNRDLRTMETDLAASREMAKIVDAYPHKAEFITESGLKTGGDVYELQKLGYRAFLVGTTFMKAPDPGEALKKMKEEWTFYRV